MKQQEETFTLAEAQEAALYSELSYYNQNSKEHNKLLEEIRNHGGISKLKQVIPFYKTKSTTPQELAGIVAATDDKFIIAYHGTDSLDEIRNDLDSSYSKMTLPNSEEIIVHNGFLTEFELSNEDRKRAMKEAQEKRKYTKITYNGHSLGGALAPKSAMYDANDNSGNNILEKLSDLEPLKFFPPKLLKNTKNVA